MIFNKIKNKLSICDKWILDAIQNPEWNKAGRVHDWRNYVCDLFRDIWEDLSEESKLIIAVMANERADGENWD